MELRAYQSEIIEQSESALSKNGAPCVVAPTGSGKTVMIAESVRRALERGQEALVVAHRLEIVRQIVASLEAHLGFAPQLITRNETTSPAPVTVAMVPTLTRRKKLIEQLQDRLYIADECHHQISPSWQKLRGELRPCGELGFTATPITPSGKGLAAAGYTELVLGPPTKWLMDQGFLCNYRLYGAEAEINTEGVAVRGGDYAIDQLEERVLKIQGSVLRDWKRYANDQSTICVGVNVEHAHDLADMFNDAGIPSAAVDGSTPTIERDRIFADFRSGEIKILCACAVVDEGLDVPSAACLQLLRPTKSIRLYKQLVGRVLRPSPGKRHATIIDHGGAWRTLPLPDEDFPWDLNMNLRKDPVKKKGVVRNRVTHEIEDKPLEIKEDRVHLSAITREGQRQAKREAIKRRFQKAIRMYYKGILPIGAVMQFKKQVDYMDKEDIDMLAKACGMSPQWAKAQAWLSTVM